MATTIQTSKLVTYQVLQPTDERLSKLVTYQVLGPPALKEAIASASAVNGTLHATRAISAAVVSTSAASVRLTGAKQISMAVVSTSAVAAWVTRYTTPPPALPPSPAFGDADYQQAMMSLLPRGRIWRTDQTSMLSAVMLALAPTYTRSTQATAQLLVDVNPDSTQHLLPEWEASLGLPDPCTPLNPTLEQRQEAVRAKWGERGGQSAAYFNAQAAALGFTISIDEFATFRAGVSTAGQPAQGQDWAFAWQINAPQFTVEYFRAGAAAAGDPLASWGNTTLQCKLQRLAPAHAVLMFNYS